MSEKQFTIHFEPRAEGGQVVTVPEIGARIEIAGTTPHEAQSAALAAITAHLEATRKERRPRRRVSHQPQAS